VRRDLADDEPGRARIELAGHDSGSGATLRGDIPVVGSLDRD
jgi:hypothetical protein